MDRKKILDKIAKLSSVSDDQRGTPEGEAAERMILKLAHKYRIDMSELNKDEEYVYVTIDTGKKRIDNAYYTRFLDRNSEFAFVLKILFYCP